MKNAVIGFILLLLLVLSGVAINTVNSKQIRQNELDSCLDSAMKKSLEALKVDDTVHMADSELAADAMEGIMQGVKSGSDYEVCVYRADAQDGALDMEVRGTYKQIVGKGKVAARRSLVYDDWKTKEKGSYTVLFKDGNDTVKELQYKANAHLFPEELPRCQGIKGWKLATNGQVYTKETIGNVSVVGNLTFSAVRGGQ